MTGPLMFTLKVDSADTVRAALEELKRLLPADPSELDFEGATHLRAFLLNLLASRFDLAQPIAFDFHQAAPGTAELLLTMKPSQVLLDLLAALRARHRVLDRVEQSGHEGLPCVVDDLRKSDSTPGGLS